MRKSSQHASAAPAARRRALLRLALAAVALTTVTCAWARPSVVVSIHPYASLVSQIGGDRVTVTQLLPSGASPHTFDPTPSQARLLTGADLVVMNGGVDDWLRRLVRATAPAAPLVVMTERLAFDPIQGSDGAGANPHIWLDPSLMAKAVPVLVQALSDVDPGDRAAFEANGASLAASLAALDRQLQAELAPLKGAPFVPFHDAWPYFARHFGLALIVSIEPSPGREPSPRFVAAAVADIRRSGARAVFGERQLDPRPAHVVAESAGVGLATLDPIGESGESYQDLMRANVAAVVHALAP